MAADWTLTAGDTEPLLYDQLEYSNSEPANLEGATVKFILRSPTATEPVKLMGEVVVVNAAEGKLYYAPSKADTVNIGNYMANWHVTFAGGEEQTFPTVGYLWLQIQPALTTKGTAQIIGLPEVIDRCQIPPGDRVQDDKLLEWIAGAQILIENETGPILGQKFDEFYEGGHSTIALRNVPSYGYGTSPIFMVIAVSEYRGPIEYNLALVPTPTQGSVYSTMAHGELGTIVRRTSGGGTYPFWSDPSHPAQSVHVVYYVGQETVPANVQMAVVETLRWWWNTTQPSGRGFMTAADAETALPMVALPPHALRMLAPTKRPPVVA
jgi:hypothetical protein